MHTFEITDDELKILSDALSRMPYGVVAPLVQKLSLQLQRQKEPEQKRPELVS